MTLDPTDSSVVEMNKKGAENHPQGNKQQCSVHGGLGFMPSDGEFRSVLLPQLYKLFKKTLKLVLS